jgi:hypothetical protein
MRKGSIYRKTVASQLNKGYNATCSEIVNGKTIIHFPLHR